MSLSDKIIQRHLGEAILFSDVKEFIKELKEGCGRFICWRIKRDSNFNISDTAEKVMLKCGEGVICPECLRELAGKELGK